MISTESGSIRLFRVSGIQVLLHWSWLLVAWWQISMRRGFYDSIWWNVAEYLALFAIVLLHEFGHAFASRQVGGESREILLWPFGGIAFVKVPPRPGAELWSIAAGPLVNVALWPLLAGAFLFAAPSEAAGLLWKVGGFFGGDREFFEAVLSLPELQRFLVTMYHINLVVLMFNMLPIYPLDGGQMLRSLLWFRLGRASSLQVATAIGFVGVAALLVRGAVNSSIFSIVMAFFLAQQCLTGWRYAKSLRALERIPRHVGFRCPSCRQAPPGGPAWLCERCANRFDPFSTRGVCPHCQAPQARTACPHCGAAHPLEAWETENAR